MGISWPPRLGAAHAHRHVAAGLQPAVPRRSGLPMPVATWPQVCNLRVPPLGAAHPRRRTLAAGILPCARSVFPPLRHPDSRRKQTPAPGARAAPSSRFELPFPGALPLRRRPWLLEVTAVSKWPQVFNLRIPAPGSDGVQVENLHPLWTTCTPLRRAGAVRGGAGSPAARRRCRPCDRRRPPAARRTAPAPPRTPSRRRW